MAVDMLTNALPHINGGHVGNNGQSNKKAEYKLRKHRLEKLDSTISDLPLCFDEWLHSLNGYCGAGRKLASLLETVLEETPLLMTVSQYKEACEQLNDKCKQLEIHLQPEFVAACKKVGPCVSQLRNSIGTHSKSLNKYESAQSQYENISESASKAKIDQAETKFKNALQDFVNQDKHLAEATDELDRLRVESMGKCFLSLLEAQSTLLSSAVDVMGPLGSYKEIGQRLIDTKTTSVIKEATLGWLAAAQVYRNLRTYGSLSRNDIQCMMFTGNEGLPETIRRGLNSKVDQLLKSYLVEVEKTVGTPRILKGGFHKNPKGIELALKDCCSELEAVGAGAPHVQERHEKEEQIDRDIPRTVFHIGSKKLDVSFGKGLQDNVQDKLSSIEELASCLSIVNTENISSDKIHEFAFHVLNEACTTVTHTSAKTAVQLVYGKANLILVRASPNPDDFHPVDISTKGESTIIISVRSSWWLVEDYATLAYLCRLPASDSYIAVVYSTYTIELSFNNFLCENPKPEIPTLSVECVGVSSDYFSSMQYASPVNDPPRKNRGFRSKSKKNTSFQSYLPQNDDERDSSHGRLSSIDSDGPTDGSSHHSSHGNSPLESLSRSTDRIYSGRGLRSNLHRTPSIDTISTVTSGVTLKAAQPFEEDITDIFRTDTGKGLTEDRLKALSRPRRYSKLRRDHHMGGDGSRNEDRREDWDQASHSERQGKDGSFSNKQSEAYSPGGADDFSKIYLSKMYMGSGYHQDDYYYGDKDMMDGTGRKEGFEENDKEGIQQSQVIGTDPDGGRSHNSHVVGANSLSVDSGIVLHPKNIGERINGRYHDELEDGSNMGGIVPPYFINHRLGPFMPPPSSDSEPESPSGGRDGRSMDGMFGGFHTPSRDDIPRRPSSSTSSHGPSHMGGHKQIDSGDSLSLPDKIDYNHPPHPSFNQAPGSHLIGHQRHSSLSSTSSDFGEPLSQPDMPINSFSQETPLQRREDQEYMRMNYTGSYEMRGRSSQYPHFGSDPYPNPPPPNFPPERQSRTLNRNNGRMMQEDFSPGPPPPMMRHPQGPGPGPGPGPYWDNYPPGHHPHIHGPPPPGGPHHHGHPPPPRGHPVPHDMPPFHHMGSGFRSTTPDIPSSSSSLSSMSPAPSPHPTPPTTPPPHHPQMIPMVPSPMRMTPQRGPHPIGPGHRPVMPPHDYQDFHMQHVPPLQMQRGLPPGHLSGGGPHHGHSNHMGPPPHQYIHHHQQQHHGRMPIPGPPEWEWNRHP